ncbi:MAG: heavy metal-binding domain-containing protein [candidate division WOR-3 bacterium]
MKKFLMFTGVLTLSIYINLYGFQHETHPEGKKEMQKTCCPSKESKCSPKTSEIKAKEGEIKTLYICPMHKEVIMENRGKCPICGMKLESKKMIYKNGKWEIYEGREKNQKIEDKK